MKSVKLIAREDISTGELGLVVDGLPVIEYPMVAVEGLQIAHDLLEHQQGIKKIGSIDDELIALGGVWFVRGQHQDIRRSKSMYTAHEQLAADIANMLVIYHSGVEFRSKIPNTRKCDFDADIDDILERGLKDGLTELQYHDEKISMARVTHYINAARHYMRRGISLAKRRFKSVGGCYAANFMFWEIAYAVDNVVKQVEVEGQEFILKYDRNCAYCDSNYSENY